MKKHLLFLLGCGAFYGANAQVVMENHLPAFGSGYSMNTITSAVPIPSSGATQTWDYGGMTTAAGVGFTVLNPISVPAQIRDSVPGSTFVVRLEMGAPEDKAPYDFFQDKTTYYLKIASKGSGSAPPEKKNDTSMVFGQTFESTIFYNHLFVNYAGYGTLTAKSKVYDNVVLLKSYPPGGIDTLYQIHQFSPGYQLLLSMATHNDTIVNKYFFEPTSTGLRDEHLLSAKVFPVPAHDYIGIQLETQAKNVNLTITDLQGKTILEKSYTAVTDISLDVSGLKQGIYLMQVQSDALIMNRKLVIN